MIKKNLIINLAEGLGNQMFMYASALAFAKKNNYNLLIDNKSSFYKNKDIRFFSLNIFNISANLAPDNFIYNNIIKNIKKKFLIKIDKFKYKKQFLIEKRFNNKSTKFTDFDFNNFSNTVFMQGNFESELYFKNYKNLLKVEFSLIQNSLPPIYKNLINNNGSSLVAVTLRQNRFSERIANINSTHSKSISEQFVKDQLDYIKRGIFFFKSKIKNPIFLIFSDNSSNLHNYFDLTDKNFFFVKSHEFGQDKIHIDMNLMLNCKNFIVGPTTFNWWPAWLNYENQFNTIVIRPKNINVSNNLDFWPKDWVII